MPDKAELTKFLAAYIVESRYDDLPEAVRHEGERAFLNWLGCVYGGCQDPVVEIASSVVEELAGREQATVIGRGRRLDMASEAYLNCMSSCVDSYNDTHLSTIIHPTGPVASALLALAEKYGAKGVDFVHALALGIEVMCRMGIYLQAPPSKIHIGFNMTGLTAGLAAAAAAGKLLGLNQQQMACAFGVVATHAGGLRQGFGDMGGKINAPIASRNGLIAALFAARGFTASDRMLEGPNGYGDCYAGGGNISAAMEGLGHRYELLANMPKPYPCAIVIHPIVDVCLELADMPNFKPDNIERVELTISPVAEKLTSRREPQTAFKAQVSHFHWAAAVLLHKHAGFAEAHEDCVHDPAVIALSHRITAVGDSSVERDEAKAVMYLADGRTRTAHVTHCRGSAARPMTDSEIEQKYLEMATARISPQRAKELMTECWRLRALDDVGDLARRFLF